MKNQLLVLFFFLTTSYQCFAQDTLPRPKFYSWLEKRAKVSLRKSFDASSKDEGKPASFFWFNDKQNKIDYLMLDLGIKFAEFELLGNTNSSIIILPKVEWHTDKRDKTKKNNLSGGVNLEYFPIKAKILAPWALSSFDFEKDAVKDVSTLKSKFLLSVFGTKQFLPGYQTRNKRGEFFLRYYPYSGFETFRRIDSANVISSYWTNRLFVEYWPITAKQIMKRVTVKGHDGMDSTYSVREREGRRYLQITAEYTYRMVLKDRFYKKGDMGWLALGLNVYPDGIDRLGIGVEYNVGYNPSSNFDNANIWSLGLKLKL